MNRKRFGHLRYNPESRRYVLDGRELHCGDGFEVLINREWIGTRIEIGGIGNGWYLVNLSQLATLDGLEARSYE